MRSRKSSGVLQLLKPPSTTLKRNNEFEGKKLKNKPKTRKLEKKKKEKEGIQNETMKNVLIARVELLSNTDQNHFSVGNFPVSHCVQQD